MNDHDLDSVIDDVLDGVAAPAESDWLKQRLERDPSARARYSEREWLFRSLNPGEMLAPPSDLLPAVMDAIRQSAPPEPAAPGWWSAIREAMTRRPALGLGYALGAGAALGVLATLTLVQRSPLAPLVPLPVDGSMVPPATAPTWTVEDRMRLQAGPAEGNVRLVSHGGTLIAEIESVTPARSHWTLEYDPGSLRVMAIDRARGPEGTLSATAGQLEIETGGMSLTRLRIEDPRGAGVTLKVELREDGGATGSGTLHTRAHPRARP